MFARCNISQWVPDSAAFTCQVCNGSFGLIIASRHHCRCCGRCVCDNCFSKQPYAGGGIDKTCTTCVQQQQLQRQASQQPPQQFATPVGVYPAAPAGGYYPAPGASYGYPAPVASYGYPAPPPGSAPPPGYPMPQQQPQPLGAGYPQPLGGVSQAGLPPPMGGLHPGVCDEAALQQICQEFEMKPQYLPSLHSLLSYDVALICDDSGSMALAADADNPNLSRWAELKQAVQIILRVTAAMGKIVDVYFINRGVFRGVSCWADIAPQFIRPPGGMTNTVAVMQQLWSDRQAGGVMQRPLVVHLFTDGHPTNAFGNEDMNTFAQWLRCRPAIQNTYFAILLCTDDEEVCNMYRPLEYRVQGRFGWTGSTCGIQGVDVTEDYRGEKRDILALRGPRYSFTFGDFIAKCLVGVIDPQVHMVDLPAGSSLYYSSRQYTSGGGCGVQ